MSRKKLIDFLEEHGIDAKIIDTCEETASVANSSKILGLIHANTIDKEQMGEKNENFGRD